MPELQSQPHSWTSDKISHSSPSLIKLEISFHWGSCKREFQSLCCVNNQTKIFLGRIATYFKFPKLLFVTISVLIFLILISISLNSTLYREREIFSKLLWFLREAQDWHKKYYIYQDTDAGWCSVVSCDLCCNLTPSSLHGSSQDLNNIKPLVFYSQRK